MNYIKNIIQCQCKEKCKITKYDKVNERVYYYCEKCGKEIEKLLSEVIAVSEEDFTYFTLDENGEIRYKTGCCRVPCLEIITMDQESNKYWLNVAYGGFCASCESVINGEVVLCENCGCEIEGYFADDLVELDENILDTDDGVFCCKECYDEFVGE